ncbi:hypothetical protein [Microbulbifer elongatus]|uniref:hypothetical protein n=1 Tax=Microbulbifer elongatus TaxID=86173 RepID=UPI001CFEDDA3|nr:hypothetical protein [Microbulbifer elongatus]
MSGRKKNRKHRHGQPPHELLNELNSLRDLLGSDMEADIPLLNQVAAPGASPSKGENSEASKATAPPRPPIAPQRPLQEADLPILFSPVDEEPAEEYTPLLSEADRALLRPLQDLPRKEQDLPPTQQIPADEMRTISQSEPPPATEPMTEQQRQREEFQPSLFDAPSEKKALSGDGKATSVETEVESKKETESRPIPAQEPAAGAKQSGKAAAKVQKPLPAALTENPFLPPHIRARLTGGKIPRPQDDSQGKVERAEQTPAPETAAVEDVVVSGSEAEAPETSSARERLIEQLMAEQLPELERQLRANITLMVDEIYPDED